MVLNDYLTRLGIKNIDTPSLAFLKELQMRHLLSIPFEGMNEYHQTSPLSSFTRSLLCTIATEKGRVTLTDKSLIITELSIKNKISINSTDDFYSNLEKHFGIKLK